MSDIKNILIGDTVRLTWVSSGAVPSAISSSVFDGSDTLINSASMSSSGNGHYFSDYTVPSSTGYYVAQTDATLDGLPYKNRTKFKVVKQEVD